LHCIENKNKNEKLIVYFNLLPSILS